MKKEISIFERPERFNEQYLEACGNMSWYDFVAAMPSLVFVVTGWKSNGKENACLQSWSSFREAELTTISVSWEKSIKVGICINH
jgi:hypothetical protein